MPNKLIFKAEMLTPVIQDVMKNACELWFLADDGIYPLHRKTPSFRAGIKGDAFCLTWCLLLLNVLSDDGYCRTSATTGKVAASLLDTILFK